MNKGKNKVILTPICNNYIQNINIVSVSVSKQQKNITKLNPLTIKIIKPKPIRKNIYENIIPFKILNNSNNLINVNNILSSSAFTKFTKFT